MNADEFDKVLKSVLSRTEDVLGKKAGEYATDTDRLHNFKNAAVIRGSNPAQALGGMMVKHTISVYDMINSGKDYPRELWDEKITDHINYLVLLRAIVEENAQRDELDIPELAEPLYYDNEGKLITNMNAQPGTEIIDGVHDIRFEKKEEAERVLKALVDLNSTYGSVSIGDLYELVEGEPDPTFIELQWGWENLSTARIIRELDTYSIYLPPAKFLRGSSPNSNKKATDIPVEQPSGPTIKRRVR